jgi:hypothetical protein
MMRRRRTPTTCQYAFQSALMRISSGGSRSSAAATSAASARSAGASTAWLSCGSRLPSCGRMSSPTPTSVTPMRMPSTFGKSTTIAAIPAAISARVTAWTAIAIA